MLVVILALVGCASPGGLREPVRPGYAQCTQVVTGEVFRFDTRTLQPAPGPLALMGCVSLTDLGGVSHTLCGGGSAWWRCERVAMGQWPR